jgi:AcrR family transcriptional regulator
VASRVSAEQRRRDLVDAAFRTMTQLGIKKATTRAICAEAGVHQSVFHYCFHSKKELYQELVRVVVVEMVDAAVLAESVDPNADTYIRNSIQRIWSNAIAHPDRQHLVYELTTFVMRDPELSDLAAWQYQQYFEQAERLALAIEEAADIEWSVPLPILSRMFTTVMDGLVLGWLTDRNDEVAEATLARFADYFVSLAKPRTGGGA